MPSQSLANLTRLRETQHATRLYLVTYRPPTIWSAQVDGNPNANARSFTVKNIVSVETPFADCEVWFGSTAGASDIGIGRFKSLVATTLEIALNNFDLANNNFITLKKNIRPEAKITKLKRGTEIREDTDVAYTDQNDEYLPLANFGPPAVAWLDPSTGLATVFFHSSARAVALGETITDYLWTFPNGTPATSTLQGTEGSPIAVQWDAEGQYYCSLEVADSNGKSSVGYRPVFILDKNNPPPFFDESDPAAAQFVFEPIESDADNGGAATTITVRGDATTENFPELAQVVLFAEDWFGNEKVSIGGDYLYRENICFVGFIRSGTVERDYKSQTTTFAVDGIIPFLEQVYGKAGNFKRDTAPDNWHEFRHLNSNRAGVHLLMWHSTIARLADISLSSLDYAMKLLDIAEGNIKEQVTMLLAQNRCRLVSSFAGRIYFVPNPQLLPLADRPTTKVLDLEFKDLREVVDVGEINDHSRVARVEFFGFRQGLDDESNIIDIPINALAPKKENAFGSVVRVEGIRCNTQDEANILAGLYEGWYNNPYEAIALELRANYRVCDPAVSEYVTLTLAPTQNNRGLNLDHLVCWTRRVAYSYDGALQRLLTSAILEGDSYGVEGITGPYPDELPPIPDPPPIDPFPDPDPFPIPDPPPPDITAPGDGSLAYIATTKGVAKGENLLTTPVWTPVNSGLTGTALDVVELKFDPWSSNGTNLTRLWAITKDGVYLATGLPSAVAWTQKLSLATITTMLAGVGIGSPSVTNQLLLSIQYENWVAIAVAKEHTPSNFFGQDEWRFYLIYSLDAGANWNVDTSKFVSTFNDYEDATDWVSTITYTVSDHLFDVIYAAGMVGHQSDVNGQDCGIFGGGWNADVAKVTGAAGSWAFYTHLGGQAVGASGKRYMPLYADASSAVYADDDHAYWYSFVNASWRGVAYQTLPNVLCGTADPSDYQDDLAMTSPTRLVDWCTFNPDALYLAVRLAATNTDDLFSSQDGGDTWVKVNANFFTRGSSALPANSAFCMVVGFIDVGDSELKVLLTLDHGNTWNDVGNNNEIYTDLAMVSGDYARSVKPDWMFVSP